jgi:hypothetical protein
MAAHWAGSGLVRGERGRRSWAANVGWIGPREREVKKVFSFSIF